MNIPQGYKHSVTKGPNAPLVCKLNRSIYGLKQASRTWFNAFSNTLLRNGFKQSKYDYSLFTKGEGDNFIAIFVYVDDINLVAQVKKSSSELRQF